MRAAMIKNHKYYDRGVQGVMETEHEHSALSSFWADFSVSTPWRPIVFHLSSSPCESPLLLPAHAASLRESAKGYLISSGQHLLGAVLSGTGLLCLMELLTMRGHHLFCPFNQLIKLCVLNEATGSGVGTETECRWLSTSL